MSRITHDEILNACIEGIKKSEEEYDEYSNGQWLWNAPEYLLTVNIFKKLGEINKSKFITLEDNVKKILKNAKTKIRGPLKKTIRPDGRSDIILWWGKGTPRGIIEVKKDVWGLTHIQNDINRILNILKKESDIELGVLAFYIYGHYKSKNPTSKLEKKIESIISELKKISENHNLKLKSKYKILYKDEENVEMAVAIMFYK